MTDELLDKLSEIRLRNDNPATADAQRQADVNFLLHAIIEQHEADETELGRWQDAIRDEVVRLSGAPDAHIDGSGCDSGDALDLTLAEISLGFTWLKDRVRA